MTNEPEPNTRAGEAFDPPCTDCGDTGVTFQTERACTCDAATRPLPQPSELEADARTALIATAEAAATHLKRALAAEAQIAKLQARLEVVPGWSEDVDGIACRNDTIKLQDECIAKLQADGDKLAGALEQLIKHTTWLESVAPPMCIDGKYMGESLSLADACQALTEWKDPKNA